MKIKCESEWWHDFLKVALETFQKEVDGLGSTKKAGLQLTINTEREKFWRTEIKSELSNLINTQITYFY